MTPPTTSASGSNAARPIRALEAPWEVRVSEVIGEMSALWIAVSDDPGPDSLRGDIEHNCVALLSNHDRDPIDPPSPGWLGHHARAPQIRSSGLWNVHHITDHHEPRVLDELANAIAATARTPAHLTDATASSQTVDTLLPTEVATTSQQRQRPPVSRVGRFAWSARQSGRNAW